MKIALLTRNPKLYSHQRLIETATKRGHEMVPIDYLKLLHEHHLEASRSCAIRARSSKASTR